MNDLIAAWKKAEAAGVDVRDLSREAFLGRHLERHRVPALALREWRRFDLEKAHPGGEEILSKL